MEGSETRKSYLPPPDFRHDVFISYVHKDNKSPGDTEGWVDKFKEALEIRLPEVLGSKDVDVWRDERLRRNEDFPEALVDVLARVGVLVSVISPLYTTSKWCRRELSEFFAHVQASSSVKNRVFPVLKEYVPPDERPPEVQQKPGYEFVRKSGQYYRPLDRDAEQSRDIFYDRVNDLANEMKDVLKAIRANLVGKEAPTPVTKGTVYLAETTPDLTERRLAVERALRDRNYRVVPERHNMLPSESQDYRRVVGEYLEESDLSIHLIGGEYAIPPSGEQRSRVRLQYEFAPDLADATEILEIPFSRLETHIVDDRLEKQKRGTTKGGRIKHIIWIPEGISPQDQRQQLLISKLRKGEAIPEANPGRLDADPDPTRSDSPAGQVETISPRQGTKHQQTRSVYLLCDQRDLDTVDRMAEFLFKKGLTVEFPAFGNNDEAQVSDEQSRVFAVHREKLQKCDGFLLYYGHGSDAWFDSMRSELAKLKTIGRQKAVAGLAVFLAPPLDAPDKKTVRYQRELPVLSSVEDFERFSAAVMGQEGRAHAT